MFEPILLCVVGAGTMKGRWIFWGVLLLSRSVGCCCKQSVQNWNFLPFPMVFSDLTIRNNLHFLCKICIRQRDDKTQDYCPAFVHKGQLISKANCQAMNSSKNEHMNSFFLLCNVFLFVFWKKLKTPKRHFEIIWPLVLNFSYMRLRKKTSSFK